MLNCVKVWGPKQNATRDLNWETNSTDVSFKFMQGFPLPSDVDEELLPYLHASYIFYVDKRSLFGEFSQHLWCQYGPMFSNDCQVLQNAVICDSLAYKWLLGGFTNGRERVLFHENITRFHESLCYALQECKVNESHLIALFWIIVAYISNNVFSEEVRMDTVRTYSVGFVIIMRHLDKSITASVDMRFVHSRPLWPWMLFIVREFEDWFPTSFTRLNYATIKLRWDLHTLASEIGLTNVRLRP